MRNVLRGWPLLLLALPLAGCTQPPKAAAPESAPQVETARPAFAAGQRWRYRTRPQEEGSTLRVLLREKLPGGSEVIHIAVEGLRLRNPHVPSGFSSELGHAPLAPAALASSVTTLVSDKEPLPKFQDGYDEWKQAKGGVWSLPVAEVVQAIEEALSR